MTFPITNREDRQGVRTRYRADGTVQSVTPFVDSITIDGILGFTANDRTKRPAGGFRKPTSWKRAVVKATPLPYTVSYSRANGSIEYKTTGSGFPWTDRYTIIPPVLSASYQLQVDTWERNRAEVECLNKLRDQKVHLGNAIAESRGTVAMLASRTTSLARMMANAKRGRWNAIRKELGLSGTHVNVSKRHADNWLEYQFGWLPLMSDIKGGIDAFQTGIRKNDQILSAVRILTKDVEFPNTDPRYGYSWSTDTIKSRTAVKLYCRVDNETILMLSSFGLLNPLEVAWELTPWSFAVDWVLPVGDYLQALTARAGLEFLGGYSSRYCTGTCVSHSVTSHGSDLSRYTGTRQMRASIKAYRRDHYSNFPFPKPYLKNPFTSLTRLTTMSALLRQLWR